MPGRVFQSLSVPVSQTCKRSFRDPGSVNFMLTIAPRPVSKHASSSHNTRLVDGGVAPRGWWHIAAKLLQCLQFPAWEQPLSPAWGRLRFPAWEHLPVPCLGTFAVPACDACQFPAWERLPVCMPCLGMLAVPAWDACQFPAWERLPVPCLGTFASALPGHVLQSLPGTLCQLPAWERLPMPCLGMLASPCLGRLPVPCLGTPFAGTPSLAELFSYAYRTSMRGELLRLFKPEMPRTPVPCVFFFCNERQVKRMQSRGKKNKQQVVKEVGGCVRMRGQEERGVEGRLVCSC